MQLRYCNSLQYCIAESVAGFAFDSGRGECFDIRGDRFLVLESVYLAPWSFRIRQLAARDTRRCDRIAITVMQLQSFEFYYKPLSSSWCSFGSRRGFACESMLRCTSFYGCLLGIFLSGFCHSWCTRCVVWLFTCLRCVRVYVFVCARGYTYTDSGILTRDKNEIRRKKLHGRLFSVQQLYHSKN